MIMLHRKTLRVLAQAAMTSTPARKGPYLIAGSVSGLAYALTLPSGDVARCFHAHGGGETCLVLNGDGSFLVSGGEDGVLAAFVLRDVLDVETTARSGTSPDLAVYRIAAAHATPVTCVACGQHGGCRAVVASAAADGTYQVWRLADSGHRRTIALPCAAAISLALDPTSTTLYAGGSDGSVHVSPLNNSTFTNTSSSHASHSATGAVVIGVAVSNGGKSLVSCSEDREVRVWDLTTRSRGLVLATTFWLGGAVSGVLVVKKHSGEQVVAGRGIGGEEGFRVRDDVAWTRAREVVDMMEMLRLMLREVTDVANGGQIRTCF